MEIGALEWSLNHVAGGGEMMANELVFQEKLTATRAELESIQNQIGQLTITAPFAGRITGIADGLVAGRWCSSKTELMTLVSGQALLEAFVPEALIGSVVPGLLGRFEPDNPQFANQMVRVVSMDRSAIETLEAFPLAATQGGPIDVRKDDRGRLLPQEAIYRLLLTTEPPSPAPPWVMTGHVRLPLTHESLFHQAWHAIVSIVVRESGF